MTFWNKRAGTLLIEMNWRNKLTAQGKCAEPVNKLLIKLMAL